MCVKTNQDLPLKLGNGNSGLPSHSHYTGPGTMGLYIMPLTAHTTPRPGTGQGMGPGTNGLHTHFPVPIPGPGSVYEQRSTLPLSEPCCFLRSVECFQRFSFETQPFKKEACETSTCVVSGGSRISSRWGCQLSGGEGPTYDFCQIFPKTA